MSELSPVAIFETEEADRNAITYAVSYFPFLCVHWNDLLAKNERFFSLVGITRRLPIEFNEILGLYVLLSLLKFPR